LESTKSPVPFVFVRNISNNLIASGGIDGSFQIKAFLGDTLEFVHISTLNIRIIVKSFTDTFIITLKENVEVLSEIVVLPTYKGFKKNFLALETKKDKIKINIPGIKTMSKPGVPPRVTIGSPLSFIASKLSKKEKEKTEYRRLLKEDFLKKKYNKILTPQLVKSITKLEGKKLVEFMSHCKFKQDFVFNATEYELIVAIKICFEEFNRG